MTVPYTPPKYQLGGFNCPRCRAFASQRWMDAWGNANGTLSSFNEALAFSVCAHCQRASFWAGSKLIFPGLTTAPPANPDLPGHIADDYNEAAAIVSASPRAACALLRLALQKLCVELGEPGKNINDDIGSLVKKGLSPVIQQALDVVRVLGNSAVHPGSLDLKDDIETATKLFNVLNVITDAMITQPKQIQKLFDGLPQGVKEGIQKRDAPKT